MNPVSEFIVNKLSEDDIDFSKVAEDVSLYLYESRGNCIGLVNPKDTKNISAQKNAIISAQVLDQKHKNAQQ